MDDKSSFRTRDVWLNYRQRANALIEPSVKAYNCIGLVNELRCRDSRFVGNPEVILPSFADQRHV